MALAPTTFPAYVKSPFKATPTMFMTGSLSYFAGTWNDKTGPTTGTVISNSGVTTTATLTFQINSGNTPVVGALITVVGCANSNNFNVTNGAILTVSVNPSGICTVTYTITSTTQSQTADIGTVIIPQPEVPASVPNTLTASQPFVFQFNGPILNEGREITIYASFPVLGAGDEFAVVLQEALQDYDSEYAVIGTVAVVIGGQVQGGNTNTNAATLSVAGVAGRFYRILVCGVGGASPTAAPNYFINPNVVTTSVMVVKGIA